GKIIRQQVDNIRKRSIGEEKGTNSMETFLTTPYSPPTPPPPAAPSHAYPRQSTYIQKSYYG
uniref:Uncharacterized protein n=1 Tax=Amphimedon queenslandica TaxID=400682 RepID=A0A1X7VTX3_AMPQE